MLFDYDGKKITSLRLAKGWSMAELARQSGIRQPSIWEIEKQVTKRPKVTTLMAIASALGVTLQDLLKTPHKGPGRDSAAHLTALYLSLSPGNQQALLAAAKALLDNQPKK